MKNDVDFEGSLKTLKIATGNSQLCVLLLFETESADLRQLVQTKLRSLNIHQMKEHNNK